MSDYGEGHTIARYGGTGPRRLSFPQERLFLLDRVMPGLGAYNVPTLVRIETNLDPSYLRTALEIVVARHEILRTRLDLRDGVPVQEVFEAREFELTVADLRSLPPAQACAQADELLGELAGRGFDIGGDILLRAGLVHLNEGEDLLLVVFHHMGSDHVSAGLLFAELDEIYRALQNGTEPQLPALPIQYADFAEWQRRQQDGAVLEELLEYWTEQLSGAPDRLELPADRPRPSVASYRGGWKELDIPAEVVRPLRELAQARGASLFTILTAAFQTLLHRYSAAEDIVVGTTVSGRHHEETQKLLGFFSNTLALRTDLSGDPTFTELVDRVKLTLRGALAYQELPFEKLVQVVNPERSRSHSPIFQVLFGYDIVSAEPQRLAGHELKPLPIPGWNWSRFDFSMLLRDSLEGSLHAHVGYASDLFDASTIDRLLANFQQLLVSAADPDRPISRLSMLAESERRLTLEEWNDTAHEYDPRPVSALVAAQAARTPDAMAVVFEGRSLTYSELDGQANQLAHRLGELGVGGGDLVGICLPRSERMLVALLGTLKAGAAYVPIDPAYPAERQRYMLEDADVAVLITESGVISDVPAGPYVLRLDAEGAELERLPRTAVAAVVGPDDLAYVIYTSGSTGRPKGVEIPHSALVNFLTTMAQRPGLTAEDRLVAVTTLSFDIAGLELYLPLVTGARVVIAPAETAADPAALAALLQESGATVMQATPTTWRMLVDSGWSGVPGLKALCGGEALPPGLAGELIARGLDLWNMYGPTETTIWSSVLRLEPGEGSPPIGGPMWNTKFYVVDAQQQPQPIGVPGELLIGGAGLARGYLRRPELTAEKFLRDPFSDAPDARVYRTGDLVRWREDGTLEYLGRLDHQIKLRGFRIELEEIEAVLTDQPDVAGAAAAVHERGAGDELLVAYVVPAMGRSVDVDELRAVCKSRLAPYMVPGTFIVLDAFPTTPNRKLDRRALPLPNGIRPDFERAYVPPQTPVEESLAAIWSEVLGLDRVGMNDDFFDLGGHSLLAVRMLARVQDHLGVEVALGMVFEQSTVRELATAVTSEMLADAEGDELAALLAEAEASEP